LQTAIVLFHLESVGACFRCLCIGVHYIFDDMIQVIMHAYAFVYACLCGSLLACMYVYLCFCLYACLFVCLYDCVYEIKQVLKKVFGVELNISNVTIRHTTTASLFTTFLLDIINLVVSDESYNHLTILNIVIRSA